MGNKFVKYFLLIVGGIVMLSSMYAFLKDLMFFITKRESDGRIVNVTDLGTQKKVQVDIVYFDQENSTETSAKLFFAKSYKDKINDLRSSQITVLYSGFLFKSIYIKDVKAPNKGVLLFSLTIFGLMVLLFKSYSHKKLAE